MMAKLNEAAADERCSGSRNIRSLGASRDAMLYPVTAGDQGTQG